MKKKPGPGTEKHEEIKDQGLRSTGRHGGGDDAILEARGQGSGLGQLLGREGDLRKKGRPTVPSDVRLSQLSGHFVQHVVGRVVK